MAYFVFFTCGILPKTYGIMPKKLPCGILPKKLLMASRRIRGDLPVEVVPELLARCRPSRRLSGVAVGAAAVFNASWLKNWKSAVAEALPREKFSFLNFFSRIPGDAPHNVEKALFL